ncbi:MAG: hypothetical protein U0136_05400 [Bdellovibrionota bacterium]
MSVRDDDPNKKATCYFSRDFLDLNESDEAAIGKVLGSEADSDDMLPTILPQRRSSPRIIQQRAHKNFSLQSTVSMKRLVIEGKSGQGYPTVFRPQIGAMGGRIEISPKPGFIALFVAALLTMIVANSAPMDAVVEKLQSDRPTAIASTTFDSAVQTSIFQPLFGPQAVAACVRQCSASTSDDSVPCERSCQKLSLTEYAHRITFVEARPETDAKRIVASCEDSDLSLLEYSNQLEWEEHVISAVNTLRDASGKVASGDFAKSRLLYGATSETVATLRRPPAVSPNEKEAILTEKLIRASCLRAHHTLTELALVLVQQSGDQYSVRYYSELNQLLRPHMVQAEVGVIKDAKTILSKKVDRPS